MVKIMKKEIAVYSDVRVPTDRDGSVDVGDGALQHGGVTLHYL